MCGQLHINDDGECAMTVSNATFGYGMGQDVAQKTSQEMTQEMGQEEIAQKREQENVALLHERVHTLEQNERKFRLLFENSPDAILLIDGEVLLDCNNTAIHMLRCSSKEHLLSQLLLDLLPEQQPDGRSSRDVLANVLATATQHEYAHTDCTCRRMDGDSFSAALLFTKVPLNGTQCFYLTVRDITEYKQTEETLRIRKRTLATLMVNLPGMVYRCLHDDTWTMQFVSGGCLDLTGYQPTQLMGQNAVSYREIIHQEDRTRVREEIHNALQAKRPYLLTYRIITTNGQEKWVWDKGRGVKSADSTSLMLEGFVTDITELKQAQQTIQNQEAAIQELSTPLLRISDDVVLMPLIGTIDTQRALLIMEILLEGIASHQARVAILDISGVAVVDTQVAAALIRTAQAVQLLGAQVVITGIRPEMAQTLVGLGVDLSSIVTRSTLQSGILYAIA